MSHNSGVHIVQLKPTSSNKYQFFVLSGEKLLSNEFSGANWKKYSLQEMKELVNIALLPFVDKTGTKELAEILIKKFKNVPSRVKCLLLLDEVIFGEEGWD